MAARLVAPRPSRSRVKRAGWSARDDDPLAIDADLCGAQGLFCWAVLRLPGGQVEHAAVGGAPDPPATDLIDRLTGVRALLVEGVEDARLGLGHHVGGVRQDDAATLVPGIRASLKRSNMVSLLSVLAGDFGRTAGGSGLLFADPVECFAL